MSNPIKMNTLFAITLFVAGVAGTEAFDTSAMDVLVKNSDAHIKNTQLLFAAAEKGTSSAVKALIEQGTDVNAKNSLGGTPLHIAVRLGHKNVVKMLIEHHAEVNARNNEGYTPLHTAVTNGRGYIAKMLLENGARINAEDIYGLTPLDRGIMFGDANVVRILIERGALINVKDKNEWTPLHHAVVGDSVDIVRLLMEAGANIYARNNGGQKPRDICRSKEIKRMLVQAEIEMSNLMEVEMSRANGRTILTKEVFV